MASNITKVSYFRPVIIRRYSACPEPCGAPVGGYTDYQIKTATLPNKLVVASAENDSIISRVSILFKAGSRYETPDNLGVTHVLRVAAGLSTKNASQFAIIRNIQEVGARLTCSNDREIISYTLEGTRLSLEKSLPFLTEVATQNCFRPWEISDQEPRLRLELAITPPQFKAVDLLHKAAYRSRGLGNSLYIAKHQLGKITAETVQYHVARNFTPNRTAVIGLGIDHNKLVEYAKCLSIEDECGAVGESEFKGGEIRLDKGGNMAHIAIAGLGGSLTNARDALSFAILQRALGAGTSIKYTNENKAPLAKVIGCAGTATSVTALNVSYSDSGLFGALISTPSTSAGDLLLKVVEILKRGRISEDDFQRGKNQLKASVLMALESGQTAIEDIGYQALLTGCVSNACQIASSVDGITLEDVNAVAQRVAGSKLSMGCVGNLYCVPFLDEL